MTISAKDKTIIKIAACAIVVIVAWLYGFNTFNEMATTLEREAQNFPNRYKAMGFQLPPSTVPFGISGKVFLSRH